jgi:hypothetical protein
MDHYKFDMNQGMNVTLKCRKNLGHKAKQTVEPLLVHANGAPPIPGASQAIGGLGELGFLKHVTKTSAQGFYL